MDTKFADVSEFNPLVNDKYKLRFLAIRSNDGTYRDHHFALNLAWCKHACDTGRMEGFLVYFVFETNWRETFETFKSMVGAPHRKMAVNIDVESWAGKIFGDHSREIRLLRKAVIKWLRQNRSKRAAAADVFLGRQKKRVIGYGNLGDLNSLFRSRPLAMKFIVAAYGLNPSFPGKLAHQYGSHEPCEPFGFCDMNSADGLSPEQLAKALGLTGLSLARLRKLQAALKLKRRKKGKP